MIQQHHRRWGPRYSKTDEGKEWPIWLISDKFEQVLTIFWTCLDYFEQVWKKNIHTFPWFNNTIGDGSQDAVQPDVGKDGPGGGDDEDTQVSRSF